MTITFKPLEKSHFPLLLKWLESPPVKAWWDQDVHWTPELIEEKFSSYVQGFKPLARVDPVIEKPIHAFVMCIDDQEVGYIQYYNVYDFPREQGDEITGLPQSLASLDVFIGEEGWTARGIGPLLIEAFLKEHVFVEFDACFVDPDTVNERAIRAYEKAGFKKVKTIKDGTITWMIKIRHLYER